MEALLEKWLATAMADPFWGSKFWGEVASLDVAQLISPAVLRILQSHGYAGATTRMPPRSGELKESLRAVTAASLGQQGSSDSSGGALVAPGCDTMVPEAYPEASFCAESVCAEVRDALTELLFARDRDCSESS